MHDRCTSCGALILWARTAAGKRIPVNAEPVENGNLALVLVGKSAELRVVQQPNGTHVTHFATCPDAERWRKR